VYDAQVDLADGCRVVVDQADPAEHARAAHGHLFLNLAPEGHLVSFERGPSVRVRFVHMAADTERPQAMQPGLTLRGASRVAKDRISASENDIRNDLLEGRIVLDLGPGAEFSQAGVEKPREIAVGLGREALEPPQAV
jgi:hypothetical protein